MTAPVLVIDQGTTSTRSIVFGPDLAPIAQAQREFPQHYPQPGWVEHDPEDIWFTALATARDALRQAGLQASDLAAIGIANQRETTLVWDRQTGAPIHNAIVWQDRRTADACDAFERAGHAELVAARTGLRLDPYFAATKIGWLLDHVPGARALAEQGRLAFGTVDTFLLWRLTGGKVHATDATNASRTLLCNIATAEWDDDMLHLFGVPRAMLPEIRDSAGLFGITEAALLGSPVAIRGIAGDQQAALVGQACFSPGMVKATYGTGAFVLLHVGAEPVRSTHGMLTTIALQHRGIRSYALEGSIFSAGTAVQWLRDGVGLVGDAAETGALAALADPAQRIYLVPAFTGLGAPHWNSRARASITGITRGTTRKELARAVLEAVGYQTRDLLGAMLDDAGMSSDIVLRVDGGMTASTWTMQFLADMVGVTVERPACLETTALGAAYLAGLDAGVYPEPEAFARQWAREASFVPNMPEAERADRYAGWQVAVAQALHQP
ncbi:glycerol kinase GlpK [Acidisphaera sp. L21]|uniref:glycerol kinase GlpK n=1 Tax=Acidisphaera sp. L21 TaxID=1641851 RepID=UPI00131A8E0C|nr:glycerol kinase GlpK [Acidisphaera sp. L21]